jgi:GT2 family glycosyltransferase
MPKNKYHAIKPKVSIIVVNWNGKKWLDRCIRSILDQSYGSIELIVVDNGSSDGSIKYMSGLYPEVIIVPLETNLGFGRGNDAGIKRSSGDYILLFNNDAWADRDLIDNLMGELKLRCLDLIAPRENDYENRYVPRVSSTIDLLGHPVFRSEARPSLYVQGVSMLFAKELYLRSGGFDPDFFMYFEETDWCWRLRLYGYSLDYSDKTYIHHAGMGSSSKGINDLVFRWRNENCLQMLLKNYSTPVLLLVLPIYLIQNIAEMFVFLMLLRPRTAATYLSGWWYNLRKLSLTLAKRRQIQEKRTLPEWQIIKQMSPTPGKVLHLGRVLSKKAGHIK